jgi:hypothetical protein
MGDSQLTFAPTSEVTHGWVLPPSRRATGWRPSERPLQEPPAPTPVSVPALVVPLGGITRSEWEAVRLSMCGIALPEVEEAA